VSEDVVGGMHGSYFKREEEQARGERESETIVYKKLNNLCSLFPFLFVDKENAKCTRVAHNFHPVIDVN